MAKGKDYVPGDNEGFHSWQLTLIGYIVGKLAGWNIAGAATEFGDIQTQQGVYEPLYQQFIKKGLRSEKDIKDYDVEKKKLEKMIRRFVAKYLVQNELVTEGDRTAMKIPIYDPTRSAREFIDTSPTVRARAGEGGSVLIENRIKADESRPSVHPESDGVEVKFVLIDAGAAIPADLAPEDCTQYKLSKKARMKITRSLTDVGKKVVGFSRWVNLTEEEKSGPFSPRFVVTLTE